MVVRQGRHKRYLKVCQLSMMALTLGFSCLFASPTQRLDAEHITVESHYGSQADKRIRYLAI